jgi:hypothetical protein
MMIDRSEESSINRTDTDPLRPALKYRLLLSKVPPSRERTPVARRDLPRSVFTRMRFTTTSQKQQVDEYEANSYKRL